MRAMLAAVAAGMIGSCASGKTLEGGIAVGEVTGIQIFPDSVDLGPSASVNFTVIAELSGGATKPVGVTWQADGGSINQDGRFTAGIDPGVVHVIGQYAPGVADTSVVVVTSVPPVTLVSIRISPSNAALVVGQTQQFTVVATLSNGATQPNPSVTWSATGGPINSSGLYTAGATVGTFQVIARTANGVADTSDVTIALPVLASLTVTPAGASVVTGRTLQYTATGRLSNGATVTNPAVIWAATGGTITTGGLFTAGPTLGGFQVSAVVPGQVGDTVSGTVVAPPPPGQSGNLFSWSFEDGTFGGMTDGGGAPPLHYTIVSTGGFDGSRYAEANLAGSSSDGEANMYWDGDVAQKDLWLVVAIKVTTPPSTGLATQKMVIFRERGFNRQLGEMNQIGSFYIWSWLDGGENIDITGAGRIASTVGQWNIWKFHLNQAGSRPVLTIGLNGKDNIFTSTKPGAKLADPAIIDFGGTLNGGSGSSKFGFDYIQIGTVDPGWP